LEIKCLLLATVKTKGVLRCVKLPSRNTCLCAKYDTHTYI